MSGLLCYLCLNYNFIPTGWGRLFAWKILVCLEIDWQNFVSFVWFNCKKFGLVVQELRCL